MEQNPGGRKYVKNTDWNGRCVSQADQKTGSLPVFEQRLNYYNLQHVKAQVEVKS